MSTCQFLGSGFTLTALIGESGFHKIRQEWEDLWSQSLDATQFQRWEWQYYYYKYRIPHAHPRIIIVRNSKGVCVALAVFCKVVDSASGLLKVSFLGDISADYHMILCQPNLPYSVGHLILDFFFDNLNWHVSYFDLSNIPQGSWAEAVLSDYLQIKDFTPSLLVQRKTQTYAVPLPGDIETYLKHLGSQSRRDFVYDRRRLVNDFTVEWRTFDKNVDLEHCLAAVETIDRARWQQETRYTNSSVRAFFTSLAHAQANAGMYLAYVLYLDGKPAAYIMGVVVRNSYKVASIGHDPGIARHLSVGKTANFYAIEKCISLGFSEYDLTRGAEAYKEWLGAKPHNNLHIRLYRSKIDKALELYCKNILSLLRQQTWLRRVYQKFLRY
jgi:CelD/BcsL family acetyltransferase involved in cellulose biosynthesis